MNCNKCRVGILDVVALIIAIVAGVVVGVFFASAAIPVVEALIIAGLVIAGVFLLALIVITIITTVFPCERDERCFCCNGTILLIGVLGTLLSAIAALISGLLTTSIASAILVGLTAFFFVIMIFKIFSWINCVILSKCH